MQSCGDAIGCRERADSRGAGGGRMESWEFGKTGNEVRGR
jgi:hypothetical protein